MTVGTLLMTLTSGATFDVGQAVLMMLYGLTVLFRPKNFLLQGLLLGLFASAKFWGDVPFFILMFNGYNLLKHRFDLKTFLLHLFFGFLFFSSTYIVAFVHNNGNFNIIFFQLKVLKYWITHSTASVPFSSVILFLTGYHKSWWGDQGIVKGETWGILWPFSVLLAILTLKKDILQRQITKKTLFAFLPLVYLLYLGAQAPFIRYFILILPFFYSTTASYIINSLDDKSVKNRKTKLRKRS
jgi:hypothetical protein